MKWHTKHKLYNILYDEKMMYRYWHSWEYNEMPKMIEVGWISYGTSKYPLSIWPDISIKKPYKWIPKIIQKLIYNYLTSK
mgnify:CR=1 FL=1